MPTFFRLLESFQLPSRFASHSQLRTRTLSMLTQLQSRHQLLNMQLKTVIFAAISPFPGMTYANFFIPLFGGSTPPPAPAPAGCPSLQFKPLGSFLLGPAFPNPWSHINVPLNVPNCNAPPPTPPTPPAPTCPAGQSCQTPTAPPTFPSAQASANAMCNGAPGGAGLRACLDINAKPIYCCAA